MPKEPRLIRLPPKVFLAFARWKRGMTLGIRAACFDRDGRVFLIRHTYVRGWYFPGGGVEPGETMEESLGRELMEEGGIRLDAPAPLFGMYLNRHVSRRDHVAVYVIRQFSQDRMPERNREIIDCGFFAPDALPPDTTAGTRLRIAEVLEGRPLIQLWS